MPSFDVEGGDGFLKDYSATVVDAYFADGKYGTQLNIDNLLDHPEDYPHIKDGICKEWFGTGPDWTPEKNGATISHAPNGDGTPKKVNNNTKLGKLFKALAAIPEVVALPGSEYESSFYRGLHLRWAEVDDSSREYVKNGETIPAKVKTIALPVELLSVASSNGAAPADFDLASLQLSPEIMNGLTKAAAEAKSYSDFLPKAVSVPGLPSTPAWGQISNTETGPRILAALKPF